MAANEGGFKIKFLYFPSNSLLTLPLFSSLLPLPLFLQLSPFLSWWQSTKHEINFSSWDRMTLACRGAIRRLMAKLYYIISPGWQCSVSSQLPCLSIVFMNFSDLGMFPHLILFFGWLFQRTSVGSPIIDLDQWYCVCLCPFSSSAKPWHTILFSPSSPPFSFFIFLLPIAQRGWLCPPE